MNSIGKTLAGSLSALALVLGSVAASAQSTTQPSDQSPDTTQKSAPDTSKSNKGVTNKQGATKEAAQEKLDREKATLKDRVEEQITVANANIDALKKMGDNDKGTAKKRDEDMEKKISDMRDHLQQNLDKIDKATVTDWSTLHPIVQKDLNAMQAELKVAQNVTKVPAPRTGAASKQPTTAPEPAPAPAPAPMPAPEQK
jgi:hypothetical protein